MHKSPFLPIIAIEFIFNEIFKSVQPNLAKSFSLFLYWIKFYVINQKFMILNKIQGNFMMLSETKWEFHQILLNLKFIAFPFTVF